MPKRRHSAWLTALGLAGAFVLLAGGADGTQDATMAEAAEETPSPAAVVPLGEGRELLGDLNCDGSADVFDVDPFVLAITAPGQYAVSYPACDINLADCNMDGSVDVFDIDAFIDVVTDPTAHVASWSDSGCLRSSQCGDDEFTFTAYPGALHTLHANALYNCCPDSFPVTMLLDDDVIKLTEEEVLVEPCWCECCYDIEATVVSIPAGTYTVEYFWYDYDTDSIECHVEQVIIP